MARCSAGARASSAATAARGPSLYAPAGNQLTLREVGVFNTTTTGFAVGIVRATTGGNRGAAVTETCESDPSHTVLGVVTQTHAADATLAGTARQASIGAAIGAGVIFTFGDEGMEINAGTANGVTINCPTGTGQVFDFYFVFDE